MSSGVTVDSLVIFYEHNQRLIIIISNIFSIVFCNKCTKLDWRVIFGKVKPHTLYIVLPHSICRRIQCLH